MQATKSNSTKKRGPGRPRKTDSARRAGKRRGRKKSLNVSSMASSMFPLSGRSQNRSMMSGTSSAWRDATLFLGSIALVGFLLDSVRRMNDRAKHSAIMNGRSSAPRRRGRPRKDQSSRMSMGIPATF